MGPFARQCYAWKVGLEKLIKEYNNFGKKKIKILCCKQELFLLVFANGEIYSNIHSHSDDLHFLQRTIYDMS